MQNTHSTIETGPEIIQILESAVKGFKVNTINIFKKIFQENRETDGQKQVHMHKFHR